MATIFKSVASAEACRQLGERTIGYKFRNPVRTVACNVPWKPWIDARDGCSEQFFPIVESALDAAASDILKMYVLNASIAPSSIPDELVSPSAIIDAASNSGTSWLSKDELEAGWKASATRRAIFDSGKYAANAAYRNAFARFESLILKLSGKTVAYTPEELDIILAKIKDEDFDTEFGSFVLKRVESLKNKPTKETVDMNLL